MQRLTLAYRDDERTPLIFAIREIANRHYDLDVRVVRINDGDEYEAALFNGSADVIIGTWNIFTKKRPKEKRSPSSAHRAKAALDLVVPQHVKSVTESKMRPSLNVDSTQSSPD